MPTCDVVKVNEGDLNRCEGSSPENPPPPSSSQLGVSSKQRRCWNVWTTEDTRWFFEALAEYGKDFQAIHNYIGSKVAGGEGSKRNRIPYTSVANGCVAAPSTSTSSTLPAAFSNSSLTVTETTSFPWGPEVKNRDQIRHFYYRTWHKIAPALQGIEKFEDGREVKLDKAVLELYGLVNYGEIWKKKISRHPKMGVHLRELVTDGMTVVKGPKSKSKPIKIRTPVCKALKRLNGFHQDTSCETADIRNTQTPKIPTQVEVSFLPRNNASFLKVQSLAQNPRLRLQVPSSCRISSLISFLESKWSSERVTKTLRQVFLEGEDSEEGEDASQPQDMSSSLHVELEESHFEKAKDGLAIKKMSDVIDSVTSQNCSTPCSHISLSFKKFLQSKFSETEHLSSPPKSKRERVTSTSSSGKACSQTADSTPQSSSPPVTPVKRTLPEVFIEDSCSTSSSIAPLKDTVKKLAQLNKVLSETNGETIYDEETARDSTETSISASVPKQNGIESHHDEVSLPPPNSTVAQWLKQKEEQMGQQNLCSNSLSESSVVQEHPDDDLEKSTNDTYSITLENSKCGWTSADSSVTLAEIYLLLDCPSLITFTYSWRSNGSGNGDLGTQSELQYLSSTVVVEDKKKETMSLLDKLVAAASISLSTLKKNLPNPVTSCHSTILLSSTTPSLSSITRSLSSSFDATINANRTSPPSPLPNVANHLITCGQPTDCVQLKDFHCKATSQEEGTPAFSGQEKQDEHHLEEHRQISPHHFLVPSAPAPKSISSISHSQTRCSATESSEKRWTDNTVSKHLGQNNSPQNRNNKRPRIICEDPTLIHEALKQLNNHRLTPRKRHRVIRPIPVGPVSSKSILPRLSSSESILPTASAFQVTQGSHLQIVAQSSPTSTTTTQPVAGSRNVDIPICFTTPGVSGVPAVALIPTLITTGNEGIGNGNQRSTIKSDVTSTLPPPTVDISDEEEDVSHRDSCKDSQEKPPSQLEPKKSVDEALRTESDSLPCLSSLLELSLPDIPPPPVSSSSTTASTTPPIATHSFFNDNSCSSISEFISFGTTTSQGLNTSVVTSVCANSNPFLTPSVTASQQHHTTLTSSTTTIATTSVRDGKSTTTPTQSWLLNEGSNSSSLGLSSLIFNTSELL